MDEDRARLTAATDVVEIMQLILTERQAVSQDWWDLAAECHVDDAEIRLPDFTGGVRDYIRQRRAERAGGRHVRWSVGTPVVHLHHDRAVATADATAALSSADGELETTVHTTLVVRVRRLHRAWRLVSLEAFLQRVDVVSTPTGTWPAPAPGPTPHTILGSELHRLDPQTILAEDPGARTRLDQALAWAELRPTP